MTTDEWLKILTAAGVAAASAWGGVRWLVSRMDTKAQIIDARIKLANDKLEEKFEEQIKDLRERNFALEKQIDILKTKQANRFRILVNYINILQGILNSNRLPYPNVFFDIENFTGE